MLKASFRYFCLLALLVSAVPITANAKSASANKAAAAERAPDFASDPASPARLAKLRLSDSDIKTYKKIFVAQRKGDRKEVDKLAKSLSDRTLLDWATMRNTVTNMWLPQEVGASPRIYRSALKRTPVDDNAAESVGITVALMLKTDDTDRALSVVQRAVEKHTIDRIEAAKLYAQIASARLYNNDAKHALGLSHLALQIGGVATPEAAWTAGISSWMLGDYRRAASYFAWPVRSPYADAWLRSASSYWTARALMRTGHYKEVSAWLVEAAQHPRSFYGLIATRALGAKFDFNWAVAPFSDRHHEILAKYPGAVRALKLAQVGQMDMARMELALLDDKEVRAWRGALTSLAAVALKPDAAISVAGLLQHPSAGSMDTALYPLAPWTPKDGYRLDPALINAFIRQESKFKPAAQNKVSGATGLLQLMPRTALSIDRTAQKDKLKSPEMSISLGQKYLEELLGMTNGDLFQAAIAYNAGPTKLSSWKQRFAGVDDPLLFIELIPYSETRAYVERVMANYWIYSLRMGIGVASLDAVAGGQPARYAKAVLPGQPQIVVGAAQTTSKSR